MGIFAACVRDGFTYSRQQFYQAKPAWDPVFEPDAAMLSGIGDGIGKINQAVPGYFGPDNLWDLTGIAPETYNGDKKKLYLDAYKKRENKCIPMNT